MFKKIGDPWAKLYIYFDIHVHCQYYNVLKNLKKLKLK